MAWLLGTNASARLGRCRNPVCFLMFVDLSRPGRRAWRTMRRCGDLQKIARYRGRRNELSQPPLPPAGAVPNRPRKEIP